MGKKYDTISGAAFSPDSKHLVYVASRHDGANNLVQYVVVDGSEGKPYDNIFIPRTVLFDSPDTFHYLAARKKDIYLAEETIK